MCTPIDHGRSNEDDRRAGSDRSDLYTIDWDSIRVRRLVDTQGWAGACVRAARLAQWRSRQGDCIGYAGAYQYFVCQHAEEKIGSRDADSDDHGRDRRLDSELERYGVNPVGDLADAIRSTVYQSRKTGSPVSVSGVCQVVLHGFGMAARQVSRVAAYLRDAALQINQRSRAREARARAQINQLNHGLRSSRRRDPERNPCSKRGILSVAAFGWLITCRRQRWSDSDILSVANFLPRGPPHRRECSVRC